LRFHGSTQRLCIVGSYKWVKNKKGTVCYLSMATVVTRTRHGVILQEHGLSCCMSRHSELRLKGWEAVLRNSRPHDAMVYCLHRVSV
jgi:hypothetical protein